MREHNYRVYFMASRSHVLYIGITNNLVRRLSEHQRDLIDGFSKKYRCHRLVYFESFDRVENAIQREKQLKRWNRAKKVWLIEGVNPTWETCQQSGDSQSKAGPSARQLICEANQLSLVGMTDKKAR